MAYYDLVIVGSGPAGMTAAIYAARANLSVLLLDKLAPGGQIVNTNEIQNYTGFGTINGAELAIKMYEHTQELQVVFDYKTVKEIRLQGDVREVHCVETDAWMATKIPGIFGAGDCISKNLRQVVTACSDGAIAAQGAAHYIQDLK